jgi:hypothetical protein
LIALGACGGDGDSDEDRIRALLVEAIETTDPSSCSELASLESLERQSGLEGEAALRRCEMGVKQAADDPNTDAKVQRLELDGDTATAEVSFENEGKTERATVTLTREDEAWKLDHVRLR